MKYADQTTVRAGDKVFGVTTPKGLRPSVIAGRVEAVDEVNNRIWVLPEVCGPVWMDPAQCAPAVLPVPPAAETPIETETKG